MLSEAPRVKMTYFCPHCLKLVVVKGAFLNLRCKWCGEKMELLAASCMGGGGKSECLEVSHPSVKAMPESVSFVS